MQQMNYIDPGVACAWRSSVACEGADQVLGSLGITCAAATKSSRFSGKALEVPWKILTLSCPHDSMDSDVVTAASKGLPAAQDRDAAKAPPTPHEEVAGGWDAAPKWNAWLASDWQGLCPRPQARSVAGMLTDLHRAGG